MFIDTSLKRAVTVFLNKWIYQGISLNGEEEKDDLSRC